MRSVSSFKHPLFAKKQIRSRSLLGLMLLVYVGSTGLAMWPIPASAVTKSKKPNIIFILTDDESRNLIKYMPNTRKYIRDRGANFTKYYDNTSLCCTARASILRGQYVQNTQVYDNSLPLGGFMRYHSLGLDKADLGVWMRQAGYTTSLMGKYFNDYPNSVDNPSPLGVSKTWVPSGWNDWFVPVDGSAYFQYNYTMNRNGSLVSYGHKQTDYMTDVISRRATSYIKKHKDASSPYFMYLSTYSPHVPSTVPVRYKEYVKSVSYPKTAAYNEADVSDKPPKIASQPALTKAQSADILRLYRKRVGAVKAVDDMVGSIYKTLKSTGQLDNTYLIFTSDNGYHMGEHRLEPGKYTAYETDVRLPFFISGPNINKGKKVDSLVGNIDIAPTVLSLAGVNQPSFVDGVSLEPLAKGSTTGQIREYFLLQRRKSEFTGSVSTTTIGEPAETKISGTRVPKPTPFIGLVSNDGYKYIKDEEGFEEYYDLNTDPLELRNLLYVNSTVTMSPTAAAVLEDMKQKLPTLAVCKASSCNTL